MVDQLKVQLGEETPSSSDVAPYIVQVEDAKKALATAQDTVAADVKALDALELKRATAPSTTPPPIPSSCSLA